MIENDCRKFAQNVTKYREAINEVLSAVYGKKEEEVQVANPVVTPVREAEDEAVL